MIRRYDIRDLDQLALDLTRPGAAAELGILVLCLLVAWGVVRLMRGRTPTPDSLWFGDPIVDGVLFPVLALVFAYVAREVLETTIRPAVFRVAIPILVSLVVLRLTVRALTLTFPNVPWVRTVERSISWFAWIAVVLWVTGLAQTLLDANERGAMEDRHRPDHAAQRRRRHDHRRHRPRHRPVDLRRLRARRC